MGKGGMGRRGHFGESSGLREIRDGQPQRMTVDPAFHQGAGQWYWPPA